MRLSIILLAATLVSASWFSSDEQPTWKDWDASHLQSWLKSQGIQPPKNADLKQLQDLVSANWNQASTWTYDQYSASQRYFQDLKEDAFAAWDEARLRQFLLEQGIIAPKSTREQLALLAKKQYRNYRDAAASLGASASAAASTAVYGDKQYQASQAVSSAAARATEAVVRTFDDSKDYIYSTWDDNEIRTWLEEQGIIKTKSQATRDELLAKMKGAYAAAANPVWQAWSTSYIHEWLVSHKVIKSDYEKTRDKLVSQMEYYFYLPSDSAYSAWTESEMRQWLIAHDIIKSDAQIQKEKMEKLVADNYNAAVDTVWGAWRDSDMRDWLIAKGYMRSDAQVKRDELIKLMQDKYTDVSAKTAEYLTWPDARLRAWLRWHGVSEAALPTVRSDLLHEVRIRYALNQTRVEYLLSKIRATLASSVETAEDKLNDILSMLTGSKDDVLNYADQKYKDAVKTADTNWKVAQASASSLSVQAAKATADAKKEADKKWKAAEAVASSYSNEAVKASSTLSQQATKAYHSASASASKSAKVASKSASSAYAEASKSASSYSSKIAKATQAAKEEL